MIQKQASPVALDHSYRKDVGSLPLFDPVAGTVVIEPPGDGEGYWAGAPSALWNEVQGRFYLSYRLRTPLGDRGWTGRGEETVIAVSSDGQRFETLWSAHKEAFDALSIEKSCLMLTPEGSFRLYVSYSSRHDFRWRIDMLEADDPRTFDPQKRVNVLSTENTDTEGVKDPVIFVVGGLWHLYANMAPRPKTDDWSKLDRMHRESNAFVSGEVACPTGLAVSPDGIHFHWVGEVISCGDSWDRYLARISSLVYTPPSLRPSMTAGPTLGPITATAPVWPLPMTCVLSTRWTMVGQGCARRTVMVRFATWRHCGWATRCTTFTRWSAPIWPTSCAQSPCHCRRVLDGSK